MIKKIGYLGLGTMGSGMAANLLKAGYEVTVWNRSAEKCEPLARKGANLGQYGVAEGTLQSSVLLPDHAALIRAAGSPPSGPAMPRHRVAEHRFALDCSGSLSQRARRIKPADRTNLLWPRARQGTPGCGSLGAARDGPATYRCRRNDGDPAGAGAPRQGSRVVRRPRRQFQSFGERRLRRSSWFRE